MKGIATGDWHLGSLEKHFDNALERQFHEIDKMYQYAVSKGIPHIFVNGDISDTPVLSYSAYIMLFNFLRKYDGIIETHYIAGNHDFAEVGKTSLDFLKVLCDNGIFKSFHVYLQPEQKKIEDTYVNFCPYPVLEAIDCKRGALNLCHVEYNGALGDNGRKMRVKAESEFTQPDKDFTISGHIHQYQMLESKRALYSGNPYQKNFGEALPKGYVRFETESKKGILNFDHRFVNGNPDFTLRQLLIEQTSDLEQLKKNDSIRYKLWIGNKVKVPDDLLSRYPNITGGIFDLETKKKTENIVEREKVEAHTFDLKFGLKKFLKKQGHDKKQIKMGQSIVDEVLNELGISQHA